MALLPYVAEGREERERGPRATAPGIATGRSLMEIVLRQDVDKLGLRGEVVNVARGYARNYLLPRGLAEVATPALAARAREARRAARTARGEVRRRGARDRERLEAIELRFDVNAGPTARSSAR